MKLYPRDKPAALPPADKSVYELLSLRGKTCVVTGGSKGIGAEIVDALASAGGNVAIMYRSTPVDDKVKELNEKYNVKCKGYYCDVTSVKSLREAVDAIASDYGEIHVFVANAGVGWVDGAVLDIEDDEEAADKWENFFRKDLDSVHYSARAIGPTFRKQGFGSLVITGSLSGKAANVPQLQAPYNAAKAAVLEYAKSLAIEWVQFARVNTVSPGYVGTSLLKTIPGKLSDTWNELIPMGRIAQPKELAGAYLYLASDASTYTTGTDISVDGGYTAV